MKKCYMRVCNYCLLVMLLLVSGSLSAQTRTVSGVVTDNNNEPIMGATVIVKGTQNGSVTGPNGSYSIDAPGDATLVFQYQGNTTEVPVNNSTSVNAQIADANVLDDVIVVGYGTVRRGSITGSVASLKGSEMIQTKNENPENMLTGRLAGVRVWQKSAEPGAYNSSFDIRGFSDPLVVIDGVPRTMADFQRMNPVDIEDISVLKDASAAIYGSRSANGVLLVTTKKGKEGKARVTYNGSFTFQKPSNMPLLADPIDGMTLFNEMSRDDVATGGNPTLAFPEWRIQEYRDGTRTAADWTSYVFANWSPQTQHDLSISGGSEKVQYYVSMGYSYQDSFFKSGDLNYHKFNVRSNLSAEIAKGLTFSLGLSGVADTQNQPYTGAVALIRNYWRQGTLAPVYADPEETMLNYDALDLQENTVAMMTSDVSGFKKYQKKFFSGTVDLKYDFGTITDALRGLSVKALAGYDYRLDNNSIYKKAYYLYKHNTIDDSYTQSVFPGSSPSSMRREFYDKQQLLGQIMLNYDRTFAEKHKVGALIGWEVQKNNSDNFYASRDLAYSSPYLFAGIVTGQQGGMNSGDFSEYAQGALIGRLNYSYADRYIVEAQFRYDGASTLAPGYQWHFFPSASLGWRISEEPFFKSVSGLSFINQFKLRASYGTLGEQNWAYDWMTGYTYPATGENAAAGYYNHWAPGYIFNGSYTLGMVPNALPNEKISWATSTSFDIGFDFEAWNGMLGVTFDYFDRHRTGLAARAQGEIPTAIGATAPNENLNSDRQMGLELELSHRNSVGDFSYQIKAIGTVTRRKDLIYVQNSSYGNSYDKWRSDSRNDRYQGVQFGYEGAGRYTNWDDIREYPIYKGNSTLPGDYKYLDWNGDGEITGLDEHPFAFDQTPWLQYSLSFDASYKNWDLSLLFQGSAMGSMQYQEPLFRIWGVKENAGGALEQYTDRWHTADPYADPWDPSAEWVKGYYSFNQRGLKGNSDFNRVSTAYLRLKSIELGYTIPKIKALDTLQMRVYFNAYNVFTITGVKFVDPEHPDSDLGRLYPLNRTFTLGLRLSF